MGGGEGALSHDRTATDATCERNIYVAKAQIAHATQLEHIFVATSRATVDAPARRRSYIDSTDHSESACARCWKTSAEECESSSCLLLTLGSLQ